MKNKKSMLLAVVCVIALCAFVVVPSIRLLADTGESVNVGYVGANADKDELVLTVSFDSDIESFEIGKEIEVSTTEDFASTLRLKSCIPDETNYIYTFRTEGVGDIDTIYVKPPVIYAPKEITEVSLSLDKGNIAKCPKEILDNTDSDWFEISDVSYTKSGDNEYTVTVTITPEYTAFPRFPRLIVDGQMIEGATSMNLDPDGIFDFGEFMFRIKGADSEAIEGILADSTLSISNALIRIDSSKLQYETNISRVVVVR